MYTYIRKSLSITLGYTLIYSKLRNKYGQTGITKYSFDSQKLLLYRSNNNRVSGTRATVIYRLSEFFVFRLAFTLNHVIFLYYFVSVKLS